MILLRLSRERDEALLAHAVRCHWVWCGGLDRGEQAQMLFSSPECGSKLGGVGHMATVAEWSRHRIVTGLVTSSSPLPLKTRRVGQRCTLNLSRAQTSSPWCDVVVRRGVPAQVSSSSLDHGSKLRGPSPKVLL
ncbi:uncharacterized protein TNCV_2644821 [Trichonephila clavipes]|nr:uncharacterized protein TNCV_2644821 [Trichonephila clavipes]